MKKIIKKKIELPFVEGKIYKTKFQTGETFLLTRIKWKEVIENGIQVKKMIGFEGIHEKSAKLGICPLAVDRLYPDVVERETVEVCDKCGEPI